MKYIHGLLHRNNVLCSIFFMIVAHSQFQEAILLTHKTYAFSIYNILMDFF
jgi:hypothetical protein